MLLFGIVVGAFLAVEIRNNKENKRRKTIIDQMEHPKIKFDKRLLVDFGEFKILFRKYDWNLDWTYNVALYGDNTSTFCLTKYLWIIDGVLLDPKTDDDCVAIYDFIKDYIRINYL